MSFWRPRRSYCSSHYSRNLTTTSGDITLTEISFETAIIERYRRQESSVEETLLLRCPQQVYPSSMWRRSPRPC